MFVVPAGAALHTTKVSNALTWREAGEVNTIAATTTASPTGTSASTQKFLATLGLTRHVDGACVGTGTDGSRVQFVYVYDEAKGPVASRDAKIREEIRRIDDIIAVSAARTGGGRAVRWLHNNCIPTIDSYPAPAEVLSGFASDGYNWLFRQPWITDTRRTILVVADSETFACSGQLGMPDESNGEPFAGETRAKLALMSAFCLGSAVGTHEFFHTLGAVWRQAPTGTTGYHCTDEYDLMCYDDTAPGQPSVVCPDETWNYQLDCGNDTYFHTNPPAGSYLDQNWNTADSRSLTVIPPLPPAPTAALSPSSSSAPTGTPITISADSTETLTNHRWTLSEPTCGPSSSRTADGTFTGTTLTVNCPATEAGTLRVTLVAESPSSPRLMSPASTTVTFTRDSTTTSTFKAGVEASGSSNVTVYARVVSGSSTVRGGTVTGTFVPTSGATTTLPTRNFAGNESVEFSYVFKTTVPGTVRLSYSGTDAYPGTEITLDIKVPASASISTDRRTITITTKSGGSKAAGEVTLQRRDISGRWRKVDTKPTTGVVRFTAPGPGTYRAVFINKQNQSTRTRAVQVR